MQSSVRLARSAQRDHPDTWVAASIGPYGAMLADGSEYRGNYGPSVKELVEFHRPRLETLAAAEPDLFAVETIPDIREAEAVLIALEGLGIPAWLTYSIAGDSTNAGQPLADAFGLVKGNPNILAVGINCSHPEFTTHAIVSAANTSDKAIVVYPNNGQTWDAVNKVWLGDPTFSDEQVTEWAAAGATLIGGCCRVGPAAIRKMATALR
jgi:homocysteine S-methyltransferase